MKVAYNNFYMSIKKALRAQQDIIIIANNALLDEDEFVCFM